MKKLALSLTICSVVLSSIVPVAAASSISETTLNDYLSKARYPKNVINILDKEQKETIYNNKAEFAFVKSGSELLTDGQEKSLITPQELANFSAQLVGSQISSPSGYAKIILDFNFDWNYMPVFTSKDKFGIAWSDDFTALPETAKYNYKAVNNASGLYAELGNTSDYSDYNIKKGIGWEINLTAGFTRNGTFYPVGRHKGWGQVIIQRPKDKPGTPMTTAAVGNYFHKEIAGNGSLSFGLFDGKPQISISPSISFDKSNDYADVVNWTQ
ncbi:hypothetical protein PC41400_15015 [Paenibacillus chitinolyticus]|uniref:Uncharacterized protein n=1 Tax=Paenibacillus chitinolyticus TaxID=79263 RepID=A0A410WWP6_9BACL|nr:hypothetical protein [Paenibacillus chitinolyticus]MCY9592346.1 hypothetical protein [Paenibacillus chitinolyticus]MCY9599808.1 hypothetical protein [Paenibacillus chitinolyticus]QAV18916.1 hypothetical protein PC41400_15015 [Paenibacillus chitinolyticus]